MTEAIASAAPGPSLRRRLWVGAAWLLGSNFTSQLIRLFSNLILTRLLIPADFGLVAVINTCYFGLVMLSDLGIRQSIVKHTGELDARFLGTAWAVQVVRGCALAGLVLLISAGILVWQENLTEAADSVYADPRLPAMLAVFGLMAVFQGFESLKLALCQRELNVGALARIGLGSQVIAMLATITLAYLTESAWALVIGGLIGGAVHLVLSYQLPIGPAIRWHWDAAYLREFIRFGRWIMVSSILGFLATNLEKLLLGGLLLAGNFGVYSVAALLAAALLAVYSALNGQLVFPALSLSLQKEGAAVWRPAYARAQRIADGMLGLMAGSLFVMGDWVVSLLYDHRYHMAGTWLQILAIGFIGVRFQVLEQLMFAKGESKLVSLNNFSRFMAIAVGVPAAFYAFGEKGAMIAVALSQFALWPLAMRYQIAIGVFTFKQHLNWALPMLGVIVLLAGFRQTAGF